ncbi:protein kinase, partial [Streptomyces sp. NPDC006197]|uniref:protein kinase n=1 Tax=Streptomyces sp. NPDC006197 TaxID=3156685 RepID=UPI0033BDAEF4
MDDYAGRVLADRYRLPLPPADADAYDPVETRAFDTYSGQEVLVRQVPLPEFVDAEVLDGQGGPAGPHGGAGGATRRPAEPVVRRAIEAAQAAAQIPDHPLLDQVFDVFAEAGSLWIVSERVAARPLAALLAERPLNPYRAAEIGADVLTALRALHAHGWVHRNITARTVLVCDDGRVVLSGLAVGAAEEALCGYATAPEPPDEFAPPPPAPEHEEHEPTVPGQGAYAADSYTADPYALEEYAPEEYGAEEYDSEGYGTEGHGSEAYETDGYGSEGYGSEAYETDGYGSEGYGSEAHETDGYDSDGYGSEGHASDGYGSGAYEVEVYEEGDEGDEGEEADGFDGFDGFDGEPYPDGTGTGTGHGPDGPWGFLSAATGGLPLPGAAGGEQQVGPRDGEQ